MSKNFTSDSTKDEKGTNPFRISTRYSNSTRPTNVPLRFKNLKSSTKYKVFLQNSDGSRQEDITRFCTPFGKSIRQNNNAKSFDELMSTPSGELFVNAKPYGTDNVNLTGDNWNEHWQYAKQKSSKTDVGRKNFVIVESSKVTSPTSTDKTKIISDKIYPLSFDDKRDKTEPAKVRQQYDFDVLQTFFVDPNTVGSSKTVDLTDVTLYFRNKPDRKLNKSNKENPNVTVALIDVENGQPNIERQYRDSIVTVEWTQIEATTTAETGTRFEFHSPIRVEPGRSYGIAVMFDDPDFVLWNSIEGHLLVNTDEISPGSSKNHRGSVYNRTNVSASLTNKNFDRIYVKEELIDLKFDVHIAEYDLNANVDIQMVNLDQEFLSIDGSSKNWVGSEYVFKQTANSVGTVAITAGETKLTGTGTTFTTTLNNNDRVVLQEGANLQVVTVSSVSNNTVAEVQSPAQFTVSAGGYKRTPTARVDHFEYASDILFLKNSTANSTFYFDDGDVIQGIESDETATITRVGVFPVTSFSSNFDIDLPTNFDLRATYQFSEQDTANADIVSLHSNSKELNFFRPNYIRDYPAVIASRSLEARNEGNMFDQDGDPTTSDGKSVRFNFDFEFDGDATKTFETPTIDFSHVTLAAKQWKINNDATNEHTNNGNALTKHISNRLTLNEGQEAEDIRVIQNAYRPIGTDIKVYAKILNAEDPDTFTDKNWTELERLSGNDQFSEKNNFEDYREFEYGFPRTIPSNTTLDGTVTTANGSATVTGVGTTFTTDVSEGDVIKLYSPFFDENYGLFSITAVNSDTELVINEPIVNNDIVGTGFKVDTVTTPHTGFLNPLNLNIVRYYGFNGETYDGYSTVAIKTVLLSEDTLVTPRVDDNRVVSVSA